MRRIVVGSVDDEPEAVSAVDGNHGLQITYLLGFSSGNLHHTGQSLETLRMTKASEVRFAGRRTGRRRLAGRRSEGRALFQRRHRDGTGDGRAANGAQGHGPRGAFAPLDHERGVAGVRKPNAAV